MCQAFLRVLSAALVLGLLGCSGEHPAAPPAASPTQQPGNSSDETQSIDRRYAHPSAHSSDLRAGQTAVGTFTSIDESTSGRVSVTLVEADEAPGELQARLEFVDLQSSHESLVVGGALEPRGDDPCFDTGHRSGGGQFDPNRFDTETDVGPLLATYGAWGLYEIVLHLPGTDPERSGSACIQPVIASAALDWVE